MKTLVVGAGRTGIAVANRLRSFGEDVTITDTRSASELGVDIQKPDSGVETVFGGHEKVVNAEFGLVITSPGVPWDSPLLASFQERGLPVISEIEFAFGHLKQDWIAVTGTNGKTTTVSLIGALLEKSGIPAVVCGNIGNPVSGEDGLFSSRKTVVAEISSFQLEGVSTFAPRIAAVLNITPDHLDRHLNMENYTSLKARIFAKQGPDDVTVLNMDDPAVAGFAQSLASRLFGFSATTAMDEGVWIKNGGIVIAHEGKASDIGPLSDLKLLGSANIENSLAACAVAFCAGASVEGIREALFSFEGLPHRMEPVAEIDGVRYINDSKATNVHSVIKDLEGLEDPLFVILGGRDKGGDFAPLADLIRKKNATAILMGEAADKIGLALGGYKNLLSAGSLDEAVELAASRARAGADVILSPACASFDMFKNFEERGERFRRAVGKLSTNHGAVNA